jgi:hypothetical protein
MTVEELVKLLQRQDQSKRVVVADRDGAGPAEDVEFIDQRIEKAEPVIAIWYHK